MHDVELQWAYVKFSIFSHCDAIRVYGAADNLIEMPRVKRPVQRVVSLRRIASTTWRDVSETLRI